MQRTNRELVQLNQAAYERANGHDRDGIALRAVYELGRADAKAERCHTCLGDGEVPGADTLEGPTLRPCPRCAP